MSTKILDINKQQHILVISAYNESDKLLNIIDLGVKQFINKPIVFIELVDSLFKIIKSINDFITQTLHINEVEKLNNELDSLVNNYDKYIIASRTDLLGIITYTSEAFEIISGYSKDDLIGKKHNIVKHLDMSNEIFKDIWNTIKNGKVWKGEIKNLKKDGTYYWVNSTVGPYYDKNGNHIGYSAISYDITDKKEVEKLNLQVNELLNNTGEGFLSFTENFYIEKTYSKECLKIFNLKNLDNKKIIELLFKNNKDKLELLYDGIIRILNSDDALSKELFLSLLPHQDSINGMIINIKYKILNNNRFMMILTDITDKEKLIKEIKHQNQIQKMIVSLAINHDEFLELKIDFENFIKEPPIQIESLLKELHTFKGI
ncbi:MAG: PAS domain S-box protein, partial [Arcobacteraceae bacterium]|nr:PAS domain S-box protein [Arcobacteraceae bacterium]